MRVTLGAIDAGDVGAGDAATDAVAATIIGGATEAHVTISNDDATELTDDATSADAVVIAEDMTRCPARAMANGAAAAVVPTACPLLASRPCTRGP